jgi:hypothetical protein
MAEKVIVGCKLPNGLIIQMGDKTVELKGANSTEIIGGHGITSVDKDFWDAWYAANLDFPAVEKELIWASKNEKEAAVEAKEKAREIPDFDGVSQVEKGIKPADKD